MNATAVIYGFFPDLKELKQKADDLIKTSKKVYERGFSLYRYVIENKDDMIDKVGEIFQQVAGIAVNELEKRVKSVWSSFKQDFAAKYDVASFENINNQTQNPSTGSTLNQQKSASVPITWPASNISKSNLECVLNDENYSGFTGFGRSSAMITDMYNSGYKTREIKREMKLHHVVGINSYDDVLQGLAFNISNGGVYAGGSYNSLLAEKLGANEQIIKDYESGKSFSEIRSDFRNRTGGMNISYSSYRRLLRKNNARKLNTG
jgi:hypothetical protein